MKVIIKSKAKMIREYGVDKQGDPDVPGGFTDAMEEGLPSHRIIEMVEGAGWFELGNYRYQISDEMIECRFFNFGETVYARDNKHYPWKKYKFAGIDLNYGAKYCLDGEAAEKCSECISEAEYKALVPNVVVYLDDEPLCLSNDTKKKIYKLVKS